MVISARAQRLPVFDAFGALEGALLGVQRGLGAVPDVACALGGAEQQHGRAAAQVRDGDRDFLQIRLLLQLVPHNVHPPRTCRQKFKPNHENGATRRQIEGMTALAGMSLKVALSFSLSLTLQ